MHISSVPSNYSIQEKQLVIDGVNNLEISTLAWGSLIAIPVFVCLCVCSRRGDCTVTVQSLLDIDGTKQEHSSGVVPCTLPALSFANWPH